MHGSGTKRALKASKRRDVEARVQRTLARARHRLGTDDVTPVRSPVQELYALAGRLKAIEEVTWLRLAAHDDPATLEAYRVAAEQFAKILTDMQKIGLAEVEVRIKAHQAQLLAQALIWVQRDQLDEVRDALTAQGVDPAPVLSVLSVSWPTLIRKQVGALPADQESAA